MMKVSSGVLERRIGLIQDLALVEPVTVTAGGRDRLVLLSAEEYRRLTHQRPDDVTGVLVTASL